MLDFVLLLTSPTATESAVEYGQEGVLQAVLPPQEVQCLELLIQLGATMLGQCAVLLLGNRDVWLLHDHAAVGRHTG
jgi:hypothetical protein